MKNRITNKLDPVSWTSQNVFSYVLQGRTFDKKLCVRFIFLLYEMHTCALMRTLGLLTSVLQ